MLTNNRSMKRAIAALCVATLACSAVGCGEEKKEAIPTFSNATYIAQMATLKCYYHNTAKLSHEGSWFFNNGYKRMWMEYSGIVKYGIDADKVTISPDANGHRVIITVPPAHVLDDPDVNEKSFSKPLVSTGFATSITAEEKTEMFDKAQKFHSGVRRFPRRIRLRSLSLMQVSRLAISTLSSLRTRDLQQGSGRRSQSMVQCRVMRYSTTASTSHHQKS